MSKKVVQYLKCKNCQQINFIPEQTKHLKCYYCGQWEENLASEENTKQKVREMIKYLLPTGTPTVEFPDSNLCDGDVCPGWFTNSINTITIPRKTLYLPHYEIADTTAHESAQSTIENNPQLTTPEQKNQANQLLKLIITAQLLVKEQKFNPQTLSQLIKEKNNNIPSYQLLNKKGRVEQVIS